MRIENTQAAHRAAKTHCNWLKGRWAVWLVRVCSLPRRTLSLTLCVSLLLARILATTLPTQIEARDSQLYDSPRPLRWTIAIADLTGPIPLELRPLREVNHEIGVIKEDLMIQTFITYSRCAEAFKTKRNFAKILNKYLKVGC